ncbi:MAG: LysR family transcriptional regulator [Alphaproteobacteria bacterium]|nr:LysR family transcriptional regulator [Alphaproteobacteria bacterium]
MTRKPRGAALPPTEQLSWDDVRIFAEVARRGSLIDAARAMRISVSTAGRRLRGLENTVGGPLFDRLPNGLAPTALGRALSDAAGRMAADAADLLRQATVAQSAGHRRVRITATMTVSWFVAENLGALLEACPGVEISVIATRDPLSLANREAEIALRMNRAPARGDLAVRRLARYAFTLYASPPYLAAWKATGASSLADHDFIGIDDNPRTAAHADWLERVAGAKRYRARLSELFLRRQAAADGLGVALLPCFLGDGDPRLQRVIAPPPELVEDILMLVHDDLRRLPAVRAVAEALVRLFKAKGDLLGGRATRR